MPDTDRLPQPASPIKPDFDVLRKVLWRYKDKRAYLVWRARAKDEGSGFDKIPCDPADGAFRKPNTASDRAVLTLDEAIAAVQRLAASGMEVGIGILPSRAGLIALDLDRVIYVNGKMHIQQWALDAAMGTFWERSPGGAGMRVLFNAAPDVIEPMSNGVERGQVGVYGVRSNRFVTLTGAGPIAEITEMTEVQAAALMARWKKAGSREWRPSDKSDSYPSGREGMDLAREDILSGAALHPALAAWLVRAVRIMDIDAAEEEAWSMFHMSAARDREPDRWHSRFTSIPGILKWIRERGGFRKPFPSAQRLQGIKQKIADLRRLRGERERSADEADPDSFGAYLASFAEAEGIEIDDIDDVTMEVLRADWSGLEPEWMRSQMEEIAIEQAEAEELIEAKAAHVEREGNDPDRHRWMLDMPSVWTRKLADVMHRRMAMDMPGAAALGALTAMSVIAGNRYFVDWSQSTALNLYTAIIAPTGAGKDSLLNGMEAAGQLVEVSSTGSLTSGAALHGALNRNSRLLISLDEWAKVLRGQKQDKSGNSSTLSATTLTAFERAHGVLPERSYSQRGAEKEAVPFPYVVSFGATTGAALNTLLTQEMVSDGTLNRTVIMDAENGSGGRWPVLHRKPEIGPILDDINANITMQAFVDQPVHRKKAFTQRVQRETEDGRRWVPETQVMVALKLPEEHWHMLRRELERLEADLGPLAELGARFERNAVVIAGLLRLGDHVECLDDPETDLVITKAQIEWAAKFLRQTILELAGRFAHHVVESESEAVLVEVRDKIIEAIEPKSRNIYAQRAATMLDDGLVPLALLDRMLGKARGHEVAATIQRMLDREWLDELPDDERAGYYRGKKGRPARRLFRILPGLYQ